MHSRSRRATCSLAALALTAGLLGGCAETPAEPSSELAGPVASRVPGEAGYRYTTIDVPGATHTNVFRINAKGHLVGAFVGGVGARGFLKRGGALDTLHYPGAVGTNARGLNERGDIVGAYAMGGKTHGYVLSQGVYSTLNYPLANQTALWDINDNGAISGEFQAVVGGQWQGFVWREGTFTPLGLPNAFLSAGYGINNRGDVAGHVRFARPSGLTKMLGFIWRDGDQVAEIDYPVDNYMSCAQGIGDDGSLVGHVYEVESDIIYGYVWRKGAFVARLRVSDAPDTYPTSIAPNGTVAGYYVLYPGGVPARHGFIAEPLNRAGK
jgi:uncharacterized membrane protein